MAYEVIEVGGDPEWDEVGFTVFRPKGRKHHQFEEVMDDYTPAQGDEDLEDALLELLPRLRSVATALGLHPPTVVLANLSDHDHFARFVDGTEGGSPVLLLDPAPTRQFFNPSQFVWESLAHELGHAHFRSRGVEYEPEEEDAVEGFALTGDLTLLSAYEAGRQNG
jgi:hypothetical protein